MSLKLVGSFPPQPDRVWCAAPHPRLPLVATASTDRTVRIYSLRNFSLVSTIEGGHKRSVRSLAWKPNTKGESVLATASFDSTTGIWHREERARDPANGDGTFALDSEEKEEEEEWRFAVVLDGHDSEVKSVAWSAGGSFLATCSRDKSVWIWEEMDGDNYETIAVLQEHSQDVKMVVWHPEEEASDPSSVLASASDDHTARIWHRKPKAAETKTARQPSIIKREDAEVEDWEEESCLPKAHTRTIYSIDWSKRTGLIATSGGDGQIIVYREEAKTNDSQTAAIGSEGNLKEWKIIAQVNAAHGVYEINSIVWCPKWDKQGVKTEGDVLLSTGDDGIVNVFELTTEKP
ncbi:Coronin-1A [Dactylellina cionopaga]|nr:Coronin-1A [Dactylellina cionopaga]